MRAGTSTVSGYSRTVLCRVPASSPAWSSTIPIRTVRGSRTNPGLRGGPSPSIPPSALRLSHTHTGGSGRNWADPGNWSGSSTPGPTDPVVIPPGTNVVVDVLTRDTILILRIQDGSKLTFSDGVGPLTVTGGFNNDAGGTLEFPSG